LRKKLIVGCAVVAALAVAGTAAFAAVTGTYNASFSPNKANKSAGVSVNYVLTDPAAPQPPVNNRIQISFPSGGKWNGPKFPKCSASALLAKGPKGCPSKSKLGTGTGVGYAKPVVTDPVNAKLTIFNGGSSILVYVFPDLGPTFVVTCKITGGYNLDCTIPPIKTLPSAPDASVTFFDATVNNVSVKRGKRRITYIDAPVLCDGTYFLLDGAFSYHGGVVNQVLEKFTLDGGPRCP
jgi:hypothetical protein